MTGIFYYAAEQLSVTKATDEDGKVQYTFTDKQGQKLLERSVNGSETLDTYYVYDDYGCLRFVLQPEYQTTAILDLYAFQYKYDDHNNCIWKKLPGTEHVIYEYDNADRMVFSQDGNQRSSGRKTFYEYDSLSRLVKQGETGLPANQDSVYIYNYYDNYTGLRSAVSSNGNYPDDTSGNSRGFLTGTMTKVLGTDTKLYTALYYDIEGRVTKKVQQNLLGGHDITTTTYSFSGKPLTVTHAHKDDDDNILLEEVVTYIYDEKDRVSTVKHKLDNTEVTLASYTYDTLGCMATKKLHGSATNRLTYSYNIQNWLTGISGTKFTQALTYNNGTTGYYNGNISSMNWNTNGASHSYTVDYGFQVIQNATDGQSLVQSLTNVDTKSIMLSAAASATGVGLGNVVNKGIKAVQIGAIVGKALQLSGDAAVDATISVASQLISAEEISAEKIVTDVVAGTVGGKVGDKTKSSAQRTETGKRLHREADRAQRLAGENSRMSRKQRAMDAAETANNYGESSATAVSTSISSIIENEYELYDKNR